MNLWKIRDKIIDVYISIHIPFGRFRGLAHLLPVSV